MSGCASTFLHPEEGYQLCSLPLGHRGPHAGEYYAWEEGRLLGPMEPLVACAKCGAKLNPGRAVWVEGKSYGPDCAPTEGNRLRKRLAGAEGGEAGGRASEPEEGR